MKTIKKQQQMLARLRATRRQNIQAYKQKNQQKIVEIKRLNDIVQVSLIKKKTKVQKKLSKRLKKYIKGYDKNNLIMLKEAGLKIQGKIDDDSMRPRLFMARSNTITPTNKQKAILKVRRGLSSDLKKVIKKLEIINAKLVYSLSSPQLDRFVVLNHITIRSR